jgi:hypothetical protein
MKQERMEQLNGAHKSLRKILASKGKLLGNFYFASNSTGEDVGLAVTLTVRDKKGKKVFAEGQALRKTIKGARFSHGIVQMLDGKLTFQAKIGTAAASLMKKAFARLGKAKLEGFNLKYLQKAKLTKDGEEPSTNEQKELEGEALDISELTALTDGVSSIELKWLQAQQGSIAKATQKLDKHFLSADTERESVEEMIAESRENVKNLETQLAMALKFKQKKAARQFMEALKIERTALAENTAFLGDPLTTVEIDAPLDETFMLSVSSTFDASSRLMIQQLNTLRAESQEFIQRLKAGEFSDMSTDQVHAMYDEYERAMESYLAQAGAYRVQLQTGGSALSEEEQARFDQLDEAVFQQFSGMLDEVVKLAPPTSSSDLQKSDVPFDPIRLTAEVLKVERLDEAMQRAKESGDRSGVEEVYVALKAQRTILAKETAHGPDPFGSDQLDPTFLASVEASFDASSGLMIKQLQSLREESREFMKRLKSGDFPELTRDDLNTLYDDYERAMESYLSQAGTYRVQIPTRTTPTSDVSVEKIGGLEDLMKYARQSGDKDLLSSSSIELKEQRQTLAKSISVGADPLTVEVGQEVDPTFVRALESSYDTSSRLMRDQLQKLKAESDILISQIQSGKMSSMSPEQLSALFDEYEESMDSYLTQARVYRRQYA